MIENKKIAGLLSSWKARLALVEDRNAYDALNDCIYDLTQLYLYSIPPEYTEDYTKQLPTQEEIDFIIDKEADEYLSTLKAHEAIV